MQKTRIKVLRMLPMATEFPRTAYCGRFSVMDRFSWKKATFSKGRFHEDYFLPFELVHEIHIVSSF
jgi:hypothetical protein